MKLAKITFVLIFYWTVLYLPANAKLEGIVSTNNSIPVDTSTNDLQASVPVQLETNNGQLGLVPQGSFQMKKLQGQVQDIYNFHDPRFDQLQHKPDQGIQDRDRRVPIAAPMQADDYILQAKQDIAARQLYANAQIQILYEKLHKASGFSLARQIPRLGMGTELKSLPGVSVQLPHKQKRLKESAEHQLSAVGVYWTVSDHIVRYVDQRSDLYTKVFQGDVFVSEDDLEPTLARARRINFGIEQTPTTVDFIQYGQLHSYTCMRHPVSWFSPWFQHLLMSTY